MEFNFIKPTIIFSIVGLIIPGFTAFGIIGFQMTLCHYGIECSRAWTIIWTTTIIAGIILPLLFYRHIMLLTPGKLKSLKIKLALFNVLEYVFIQSSIIPIFTNGQTLCYARDGQNGIELVLTAWLGLPLIIIFSLIYDKLHRVNQSKKNL